MTSERPARPAKSDSPPPGDFFSLLFHNHPIPMWIYDVESLAFLEVNDAAMEKYGYAHDEFLGMTIKDIRPYEDVERLQAYVEQQRPPMEHAGLWRHRLKNGRIIDVEITSHTIEFNGRTGELVMVQDVTERKQAQEALRESEQRFRGFIENASDIVYELTQDGIFAYVSPNWADLMGEPAVEALGKPFEPYLHPDDVDVCRKFLERVPDTEEPRVSPDYRVFHRDGSIRWHSSKGSTLRDRAGNVVGYLAIARDITERKQAEIQLAAQEYFFEQMFMQSSISTQILDRDGWCERINPKLSEIFGVAPQDIEGKVYNIFKDEALVKGGIVPYLESTFYDGKTSEWEILFDIGVAAASQGITVKEKKQVWYHNWSYPIFDVNGSILHVIIQHTDITEHKQAEEALRQRLAELEALHTVSVALRTAQTRDEALPVLLDETLSALETDAGVIWLYHSDADELRAAVARGWFQSFAHAPLKPGEGVAGMVFSSGKTHVSAEFACDPLVRQPPAGQLPAGWGAVCLPIRTGEITIGALVVCVAPERHVTTQQVKLLESLAEMGGAALHRMRLHEETVRRLDQLQAIHRVDQAISAGTDLRMTLNVVLEHVAAQLEVDATDVLLLNPHTLTLEYAAGRGFRTRVAERAHIRLGESLAGRAALERRAVQAGAPAQIQESPQLAALRAAEEFTVYHAVPLIAKGQVVGVLEVFHRAALAAGRDWVSLLETLAGQAAIAIENAQLFDRLQRSNVDLALAYDDTIEGWSHALDLRDKETEDHTQRLTEITLHLARAMGIVDAELVHVRRGALLHDIGKMGVPDAILLKPGPLTDEEWVIMHRHPQLAYDLLAPINHLRPALDIPYCHHERWDGTGYPRGIQGEQIPLAARLFAVVDVWDALRSDRPYRKGWTEEKTLDHIQAGSGAHFDPKAVEVFLNSMNEERTV